MRNKEESKIDEWIREAEIIEVPAEALPRRAYNERLVAFIDILGITNLVSDSRYDAEEVLQIMGQIQNYVKNECEELVKESEAIVLQLGDGFVIVAELDCVNRLCEILSAIQWQALVYSHRLLRGALTAGEVVVSDDERYFIGPAIIEVFALERQNAIFPRIILVNEIEEYIKKAKLRVDFGYIVEDEDKMRYLDFIKCNIDTEKLSRKKLMSLLTTQGTIDMIRTAYETLMKEDKTVAQKYGWLISKFAYHGIKII